MISYIQGEILKLSVADKYGFLDILTNSGIGYRVTVTDINGYKIGEKASIYTSFQVREDSQTLYGFKTEQERDFFELLLTVSGIGPKSALSILITYDIDEVATYIFNKDSDSLSKVSGLGKKGAQKLVIELENKLEPLDFDIKGKRNKNSLVTKELSDALKALGFSGKNLEEYLKKAEKHIADTDKIDELIKLVLKDSD